MTAKTAEASTVHEPLGKPGGPGLFHHKGLQLPAYIQHVAHHLIAQGHDESRAIEMAVGIVKNWAAGHDGRGNKVSAAVQAAAAANIAQWEADKAKASKSRRFAVTARAEMTAASINDLPDSAFAYIQPGGTKDSSGKTVPRSLRHFPVHDEAHARNALARAPQSPFGKQAMPKILAACRKFGIEVSGDSGDSGRAEDGPVAFVRSFPLKDISIEAGGDGRTVDAYAAVFETPAPIHDKDGDYIEVIDRRAFDRILPEIAPKGGRKAWRCGVFYNHGLTIHGTASDRNSLPVGIPLEIRVDDHGLFTRTRYHKGDLADQVLEAIKEGSLSAYSFSGTFRRSDPRPPRGGFRPDYQGTLPTVRRTDSTLREYGPTPFPAYQDASITGVRAEQITEQLEYITGLLRSGAPLDTPLPSGAPDWGTPPGDTLPLQRSVRSIREEMAAQRSAFLQRHRR